MYRFILEPKQILESSFLVVRCGVSTKENVLGSAFRDYFSGSNVRLKNFYAVLKVILMLGGFGTTA